MGEEMRFQLLHSSGTKLLQHPVSRFPSFLWEGVDSTPLPPESCVSLQPHLELNTAKGFYVSRGIAE